MTESDFGLYGVAVGTWSMPEEEEEAPVEETELEDN